MLAAAPAVTKLAPPYLCTLDAIRRRNILDQETVVIYMMTVRFEDANLRHRFANRDVMRVGSWARREKGVGVADEGEEGV